MEESMVQDAYYDVVEPVRDQGQWEQYSSWKRREKLDEELKWSVSRTLNLGAQYKPQLGGKRSQW